MFNKSLKRIASIRFYIDVVHLSTVYINLSTAQVFSNKYFIQMFAHFRSGGKYPNLFSHYLYGTINNYIFQGGKIAFAWQQPKTQTHKGSII